MLRFRTVTDLQQDAPELRRGRYGVIQMQGGRLESIVLRPWPKLISLPEVLAASRWYHRLRGGDRCWLYYNQPWGFPDFLAVAYTISTHDCRLETARGALTVLDEVARLKGSHAALADISCSRITDRHMARYGWQRHVLSSRRRHYIRRYEGDFPAPELAWSLC